MTSHTLENFTSRFSEQYDELRGCKVPCNVKTSSKYSTVVYVEEDDSNVVVTSKMKRQVYQVPRGLLNPTGARSVNSVKVSVNPPNEKLQQKVASYFQSLYNGSSFLGESPNRVFGTITINNQRIE